MTTTVDIQQVRVPAVRVREKRHDPAALAESMAEHGLINPITLRSDLTVISGCHRLAAAKLLGWTEIAATILDVGDEEAELVEIDENLSRFDLTVWEESKHIARREEIMRARGERAATGRPVKSETVADFNPPSTPELAAAAGMSERTWQTRAKTGTRITPEVAQVLDDIDTDTCSLPDSTRQLNYLAGITDPTDQLDIATRVADGNARDVFEASKQLKREKAKQKLDTISDRQAADPDGLYDVIVIDPPWPMEKIERDVRPNQVAFDYPTMTENELADLVIPAADDCHAWLWTTHKFLPMALRLLDKWSLRYVCTFVWHKPGGFQPVGLPQYNNEFAIYARRGSPKFTDTKAFPTCFNAPRGAHSEKPGEFYDMVARVTDGHRRLDMFNRRALPGFDGWGNEAA